MRAHQRHVLHGSRVLRVVLSAEPDAGRRGAELRGRSRDHERGRQFRSPSKGDPFRWHAESILSCLSLLPPLSLSVSLSSPESSLAPKDAPNRTGTMTVCEISSAGTEKGPDGSSRGLDVQLRPVQDQHQDADEGQAEADRRAQGRAAEQLHEEEDAPEETRQEHGRPGEKRWRTQQVSTMSYVYRAFTPWFFFFFFTSLCRRTAPSTCVPDTRGRGEGDGFGRPSTSRRV